MKIVNWIERITNWEILSKFINNRFINSFYIYLLVVPILAKFLSKIESPLTFEYGEKSISLDLELPFNWKLFYLSAILFSSAYFLFKIYCPKIINENRNFSDFKKNLLNFTHLIAYSYDMSYRVLLSKKLKYNEKEDLELAYFIEVFEVKNNTSKEKYTFVEFNEEKAYSDTFYYLFDHAKYMKITIRRIITLIFLVGIIFFLIVFFDNALYVFNQI